jgi:uncharacterized protein
MANYDDFGLDKLSEKIFTYNHFGRYLRVKHGFTIQKISLDAGFTCPNRDGAVAKGGCIFCDNRIFNINVRREIKYTLRKQLSEGISHLKNDFGINKFFAYFQAYTNTYADIDYLKEQYDLIREFPEIVGLSIGTRPDCIDSEKLDLIESYSKDYIVWIEYGLQSAKNETLIKINRGHTVEQFSEAIKLTENRKISICVHLVLGLPGENHSDMMNTADFLAKLPISGIKLHNICVVKNTALEKMYYDNTFKLITFDEYVKTAVDFLERIPYQITIQRLTADSPPDIFIAPEWAYDRWKIIEAIDLEFRRRNSLQGIRC